MVNVCADQKNKQHSSFIFYWVKFCLSVLEAHDLVDWHGSIYK